MSYEKEKAAHAAGKRIQWRYRDRPEHLKYGCWFDASASPRWLDDYEYRIHPEDDKETPMSTPHKHAALIKAWADGAQIEYRTGPGLPWNTTTHNPSWHSAFEYRVKPANVVRFVPTLRNPRGGVSLSHGVTSKGCAAMQEDKYQTLLGVLRIEINPDTLELVSATMERP